MRRVLYLALALTVCLALPLVAQQSLARRPPAAHAGRYSLPASSVDRADALLQQPPASTAALGAAGALGAAIGFFGGLMIGRSVENRFFPCDCDDPGLWGAFVGAVAGPALTTPLSVHLANRSRGSLARGYGWAALISGAGVLGMFLGIQSEAGLLFLAATPIVQVVVAVANERATTVDRAGGRED
jgi:hypothetical protein